MIGKIFNLTIQSLDFANVHRLMNNGNTFKYRKPKQKQRIPFVFLLWNQDRFPNGDNACLAAQICHQGGGGMEYNRGIQLEL